MKEHQFNAMRVLIVVFIGVLLSGCSTMNDVVGAKESGSEGTTKVYPVNEDVAWEIAKKVFRWEGADAIEEHRDQGYMLTGSGPNLVSWGAVMGAWIEPVGDSQTRVTVITKRRITINIATTLTEGTYHRRFAEVVEIVNSDRPLPDSRPY